MSNPPIAYATVSARPPLEKDRRGGLVAMGILSILIGMPPTLLAVSIALFFARSVSSGNWGFFLLGFASIGVAFAAAATVLVWAGIDSIRCRRWVRPVIVAIATPTLVTSCLMTAGLILYAHELETRQAEFGAVGALAMAVIILGVAIPGAFLAFYTTVSVRATLAAYDPSPSWTDAVPLPVFVGCASLVGFGLLAIVLGLVLPVPLFGVYVPRPAGALLGILGGGAMVGSAILLCLGHARAWWLAAVAVAGGFTSALVTIGRTGLLEFYRQGGAGPYTLEVLARSSALSGVTPFIFVGIVLAISTGYLLWMRQWLADDANPSRPPETAPSTTGS